MSNIYNPGWDYKAIIGDPNNPFIGTAQQTHRMQAYCQIDLAGFNITNKLEPFQLKVHIYDGAPTRCELEIDDRDGRVPIPHIGSPVTVALGWQTEGLVTAFSGYTQKFRHRFGRKQGGRHMTVTAMGPNIVTTQIKSPMMDHLGEGAPPGSEQGSLHSLEAFMQQAAANAGATVSVHPNFSSVMRDYWAQTNESFMHLGARVAQEHGAAFRIEAGNQAIFTTMDGTHNGMVNAIWGDNLIGWDLTPMEARSTWATTTQHYYDIMSAQWQKATKGISMPNPWSQVAGQYAMPRPAPNSQVAGQQNEGGANIAGQDVGGGVIVINGEPAAKWQGSVNLIGARPGVDGTYVITCAEHMYSRQGYTTTLDVMPRTGAPAAQNVGSGFPIPDVLPPKQQGVLGGIT